MNTLELLHTHRSERQFSDEAVSDTQLDAIIDAAYRAPTSINAQQISVVVVRDEKKRQRIAEIAGGQPWIAQAPVFIAVVIDFNKTAVGLKVAGQQQIIQQSVEGFAVGALDAGIALANLLVAARACGLGAVAIGGIRNNPQAMIDLLGLPALTFPIVGITIGHVAQPATQKPRLPLATFRHDESYHSAGLKENIVSYDAELTAYWKNIGRSDGLPWSANTASRYRRVYYPETMRVAKNQGFSFDA